MLQEGLAFLTTELEEFASQTVTYETDQGSGDVSATFGQKLLKLQDDIGNLRVEWTDMDFCIPSANLFRIFDQDFIPQRGHLIHLVPKFQPDSVQTFEVAPYGNEGPWKWADPHQSMFRIHTKWIKAEPYS